MVTLLKDPLDPVDRLRDVIVVQDQGGVVDERGQLHLEPVALHKALEVSLAIMESDRETGIMAG